MAANGTAWNATVHTRARSRSRWETIIGFLLTSRSEKEACDRVHISRSTLHRLKGDPEFVKMWQEAKDDQLRSAVDSLRGNANTFVATLTEISGDTHARDTARVRASEVGLSALARFVEMEDVLKRLTALEAVAGGQK
jgi:hypothetical protein